VTGLLKYNNYKLILFSKISNEIFPMDGFKFLRHCHDLKPFWITDLTTSAASYAVPHS